MATSNIEPQNLYANGLQRQRFLPAIALLQQHTRVMNVDGGVDYRLRALTKAELYHQPLDGTAEESLYKSFSSLVPAEEEIIKGGAIEIERRDIATRYVGDDVVLV